MSTGSVDLRDQFAIAALTGAISAGDKGIYNSVTAADLAADCYAMADAMLRARGFKLSSDRQFDFCVDPDTSQVFASHSVTTIEKGPLKGNYICERCGESPK